MKTLDYRVAIGLDYPALTAEFSDTFGADLDSRNWAYTEFGGPPVVSGGKLKIQLYGGACREFAVLRPHCFPRDLTKKFTITFNVTFPATDPISDAIITVGTINGTFGTDSDPLRIVHQGSGRVAERGAGETGRISHQTNATFVPSIANDAASHKYEIIYDPAVSPTLTIERDDVAIYTDSGSGVIPRPYYVMFGMLLKDEEWTAAQRTALLNGGTVTNPTPLPIMEVSDITVSCDSYETRTYPAWTSANAGGTTLDNAAEGERVSIDGETWAIVPKEQIASIRTVVGRSLSQPSDTFDIELLAPLASDPDTTPHLFDGDLYSHRPVVIDSRIGSDDPVSWADWRRHICGFIEPVEHDTLRLRLSGRDRPTSKLDTFFARGYFDVDIDESALNVPADGARSGLVLSEIFKDILAVSDAIYGDKLGETAELIRLIDQAPQMLSTGGGSLLSVLQEWVDRGAQEMWREYDVTGDARYGRLRTNLYTLGGTSVYDFRGHGATNPNILAPGVRFTNDPRKGPGQAYYRNDSPAGAFEGLNTGNVPVLGVFPAFQYPTNDRVLNDSYGQHADLAVSSLLQLRDRDDNIKPGGVAMWRYRMENSFRRAIEFAVVGHNWMIPGQVITVDDADGTGITAAEDWVIDNIETVIEAGTLRARIQATSSDWLGAIRGTM